MCSLALDHNFFFLVLVAIAYVMHKTTYVFPIIGGRKVEHLMQNIQALSIKLSDQQIKYLEGALPFDPGFPYNLVVSDGCENMKITKTGFCRVMDRVSDCFNRYRDTSTSNPSLVPSYPKFNNYKCHREHKNHDF